MSTDLTKNWAKAYKRSYSSIVTNDFIIVKFPLYGDIKLSSSRMETQLPHPQRLKSTAI